MWPDTNPLTKTAETFLFNTFLCWKHTLFDKNHHIWIETHCWLNSFSSYSENSSPVRASRSNGAGPGHWRLLRLSCLEAPGASGAPKNSPSLKKTSTTGMRCLCWKQGNKSWSLQCWGIFWPRTTTWLFNRYMIMNSQRDFQTPAKRGNDAHTDIYEWDWMISAALFEGSKVVKKGGANDISTVGWESRHNTDRWINWHRNNFYALPELVRPVACIPHLKYLLYTVHFSFSNTRAYDPWISWTDLGTVRSMSLMTCSFNF